MSSGYYWPVGEEGCLEMSIEGDEAIAGVGCKSQRTTPYLGHVAFTRVFNFHCVVGRMGDHLGGVEL